MASSPSAPSVAALWGIDFKHPIVGYFKHAPVSHEPRSRRLLDAAGIIESADYMRLARLRRSVFAGTFHPGVGKYHKQHWCNAGVRPAAGGAAATTTTGYGEGNSSTPTQQHRQQRSRANSSGDVQQQQHAHNPHAPSVVVISRGHNQGRPATAGAAPAAAGAGETAASAPHDGGRPLVRSATATAPLAEISAALGYHRVHWRDGSLDGVASPASARLHAAAAQALVNNATATSASAAAAAGWDAAHSSGGVVAGGPRLASPPASRLPLPLRVVTTIGRGQSLSRGSLAPSSLHDRPTSAGSLASSSSPGGDPASSAGFFFMDTVAPEYAQGPAARPRSAWGVTGGGGALHTNQSAPSSPALRPMGSSSARAASVLSPPLQLQQLSPARAGHGGGVSGASTPTSSGALGMPGVVTIGGHAGVTVGLRRPAVAAAAAASPAGAAAAVHARARMMGSAVTATAGARAPYSPLRCLPAGLRVGVAPCSSSAQPPSLSATPWLSTGSAEGSGGVGGGAVVAAATRLLAGTGALMMHQHHPPGVAVSSSLPTPLLDGSFVGVDDDDGAAPGPLASPGHATARTLQRRAVPFSGGLAAPGPQAARAAVSMSEPPWPGSESQPAYRTFMLEHWMPRVLARRRAHAAPPHELAPPPPLSRAALVDDAATALLPPMPALALDGGGGAPRQPPPPSESPPATARAISRQPSESPPTSARVVSAQRRRAGAAGASDAPGLGAGLAMMQLSLRARRAGGGDGDDAVGGGAPSALAAAKRASSGALSAGAAGGGGTSGDDGDDDDREHDAPMMYLSPRLPMPASAASSVSARLGGGGGGAGSLSARSSAAEEPPLGLHDGGVGGGGGSQQQQQQRRFRGGAFAVDGGGERVAPRLGSSSSSSGGCSSASSSDTALDALAAGVHGVDRAPSSASASGGALDESGAGIAPPPSATAASHTQQLAPPATRAPALSVTLPPPPSALSLLVAWPPGLFSLSSPTSSDGGSSGLPSGSSLGRRAGGRGHDDEGGSDAAAGRPAGAPAVAPVHHHPTAGSPARPAAAAAAAAPTALAAAASAGWGSSFASQAAPRGGGFILAPGVGAKRSDPAVDYELGATIGDGGYAFVRAAVARAPAPALQPSGGGSGVDAAGGGAAALAAGSAAGGSSPGPVVPPGTPVVVKCIRKRYLFTDEERHAVTREVEVHRLVGFHGTSGSSGRHSFSQGHSRDAGALPAAGGGGGGGGGGGDADALQLSHHQDSSSSRVVRLLDVYEDGAHVYLVLEPLYGGDLASFMRAKMVRVFAEAQARLILDQLLEAVQYLHALSVLHADIKPSNILLDDSPLDARLGGGGGAGGARAASSSPGTSTSGAALTSVIVAIKLCDFGAARRSRDARYYRLTGDVGLVPWTAVAGTLGYVAPEILQRQHYGPPVDLWSVGIILYEMLAGFPPFHPYGQCVSVAATFPAQVWGRLSPEAASLCRALLQRDPARRPSAAQARAHPWFAMRDA